MAEPGLGDARILVTNDDGVHAAGLDVLEGIARSISEDVWVVAPETEQSASSHSLTVRRPLRLRRLGGRRYAVDGTPTDCVVVGVRKVLTDRQPTLVLSGVNQGSNLAEDVTYSGTVAAAMEAALLGVPAIALSQARPPDGNFAWDSPERHAAGIIRRVAEVGLPRDGLVNVNFPGCPADAVQGTRVCRQGRRDVYAQVVEGVDPGGRPYVWIGDYSSAVVGQDDTDLAAVNENLIAVTPLHLDLTDHTRMHGLGERFG